MARSARFLRSASPRCWASSTMTARILRSRSITTWCRRASGPRHQSRAAMRSRSSRRGREDKLVSFYNKSFNSRLLIGSALYPSPAIMQGAIRASGAQIVTVSLRRESAGGKTGDAFWKLIREIDVTVLPNTAGCRTVREAVTTAKLARELFGTSWIKLEVIADNDTLQP